MALITFLSDFGTRDHYTAAVKAKILGINPGLRIIDISHEVNHFDIAHGSSLLSAVFRDFPKGTVHLVAVNSAGSKSGVWTSGIAMPWSSPNVRAVSISV